MFSDKFILNVFFIFEEKKNVAAVLVQKRKIVSGTVKFTILPLPIQIQRRTRRCEDKPNLRFYIWEVVIFTAETFVLLGNTSVIISLFVEQKSFQRFHCHRFLCCCHSNLKTHCLQNTTLTKSSLIYITVVKRHQSTGRFTQTYSLYIQQFTP